MRLASRAEETYDWAAALTWYKKYSEDPTFLMRPERDFVKCLERVARAGAGFCDPWLRWRG